MRVLDRGTMCTQETVSHTPRTYSHFPTLQIMRVLDRGTTSIQDTVSIVLFNVLPQARRGGGGSGGGEGRGRKSWKGGETSGRQSWGDEWETRLESTLSAPTLSLSGGRHPGGLHLPGRQDAALGCHHRLCHCRIVCAPNSESQGGPGRGEVGNRYRAVIIVVLTLFIAVASTMCLAVMRNVAVPCDREMEGGRAAMGEASEGGSERGEQASLAASSPTTTHHSPLTTHHSPLRSSSLSAGARSASS